MPTLPTNQFRPPASITETIAFCLQCNLASVDKTFELFEEMIGVSACEIKPKRLQNNSSFLSTFEPKSMKI